MENKESYEFEDKELLSINTRLLIDILAFQKITVDMLKHKSPDITQSEINRMLSEHRAETLRYLYEQHGKTPDI